MERIGDGVGPCSARSKEGKEGGSDTQADLYPNSEASR